MTNIRRAVTLAAGLMSAAIPGLSVAAATFSISGAAGMSQGSGACASFGLPSPLTSSGGINESVTGKVDGQLLSNCRFNGGTASASANEGGLGAGGKLIHVGSTTAASSGGTARAQTQFMITGPTGTVPVSLNLQLSSQHDGDPGAYIDITAGPFGFGSVTQQVGTGNVSRRDGGLHIPGVECDGCFITSQTINLVANRLYGIDLKLSAGVTSGTESHQGELNAMNTLEFPSSGFVFNVPTGYSAFIEGMNVVDNMVTGPIDPVPEPSSWLLLSLGLASLALMRRRAGAARNPVPAV